MRLIRTATPPRTSSEPATPIPIDIQSMPSSLEVAATWVLVGGGSGFGFTAQVGWPGATGVSRVCESTAVAPRASMACALRGCSAASRAASPRRSCRSWAAACAVEACMSAGCAVAAGAAIADAASAAARVRRMDIGASWRGVGGLW